MSPKAESWPIRCSPRFVSEDRGSLVAFAGEIMLRLPYIDVLHVCANYCRPKTRGRCRSLAAKMPARRDPRANESSHYGPSHRQVLKNLLSSPHCRPRVIICLKKNAKDRQRSKTLSAHSTFSSSAPSTVTRLDFL